MNYKKKSGQKNPYNNGYYPNYNLVTESHFLVDDFFYTPRDPFFLKIRDLIFRYVDLLDKRIELFFKNKYNIFTLFKSKQKEVLSTSSCFTKDNKIKPNVLHKYVAGKINNFRQEKDYWDISQINFDRHNIYVDKIKKLANDKGIDVILINIPRINDLMLDAQMKQDIEKRFGLPFIYPNNYSFLDKLYQMENYTDPTHMGIKGRKIYSRWLASEITNN